ncbi:peroxisomal acyl-coenzyme A oxidase [Achlya hypogyna]|uniref:Acyl-coenzyme A oxidase n=1 Tax=Achlya hypogyna TaxID=1202772 RepID=A0A1V9YJF9_ACHHY|nr:peroxisomal acyl-coenzyme A oxidase [Achlya hypogyna]
MPELADLAPLLLQKERATATFDVATCINLVLGSKEWQGRMDHLRGLVMEDPVLNDRDMIYRNHKERYEFALAKSNAFVKLLQKHSITKPDEQQFIYYLLGEPLPIDVHRSMFIPTLETQMDEEQRAYWVPLAREAKILGAYAQTELGHGSNVQGIETTAVYDPATQEFVLHSPTLTSRKWWPGGLGKTANHAVVHARLTLDGKDRGVQAFLVPLRDPKTHTPLPGIDVGDIGPKIGFQSVDNGYCAFTNVRIPRRNMLMRFAKVLPNGEFVKPPSDRLVYFTMVRVRVFITYVCYRYMSFVVTIATRFSAARLQGFAPGSKGKVEVPVLSYENQQLTLFPLIALSYGAMFTSRRLQGIYDTMLSQLGGSMDASTCPFTCCIMIFGVFLDKLDLLNQLHATSSGLKALLTTEVGDGMERARRACGGHGFSASSNIPHLMQEFIGACTYEGTFDVLVQQHGASLLKRLAKPGPAQPNSAMDLFSFLRADATAKCAATTPAQLLEPDVLLRAFQVRALKALQHAARNRASMHGITRASMGHAESVFLQCFFDGVIAITDGPLRAVMLQLWQLYALWRITLHLGEFRADDYLSATQATWVQEALLALLPQIRPNAIALVDGFGLTDFELNSAIGRYDGDVYRALIARAANEPLNRTDVVDGYHKYLQPILASKL